MGNRQNVGIWDNERFQFVINYLLPSAGEELAENHVFMCGRVKGWYWESGKVLRSRWFTNFSLWISGTSLTDWILLISVNRLTTLKSKGWSLWRVIYRSVRYRPNTKKGNQSFDKIGLDLAHCRPLFLLKPKSWLQ